MRTNLNRLLPPTAVLAVAAIAVSGCTVSKESVSAGVKAGSIQKVAALKDAPIKVGSKDFDEQLLLGQVAMVALEAAGAKPVDKTNIQGSNNTRLALTGGAVDLYWEYTGTAWISYLKQTKPISSSGPPSSSDGGRPSPNRPVYRNGCSFRGNRCFVQISRIRYPRCNRKD